MKTVYCGVPVPKGSRITWENGNLIVPDDPIIVKFAGDGIGPEISDASDAISDVAVELAYNGKRKVVLYRLPASKEAFALFGDYLPAEALEAMKYFSFSEKGPWETPSSGGRESSTVKARKKLVMYQNIRPVFYLDGVPSNMKYPERINLVLFRENTEGGYGGIEVKAGSEKGRKLAKFLREELGFTEELGYSVPDDAGLGITVATELATKRLTRAAFKFALEQRRKVVTIVAKGNIKKFTDGAFLLWAMEVAKEEFGDFMITEDEFKNKYGYKVPDGKFMVNYRIPDAMLAELITGPEQYSVILTNNDLGDMISDMIAEQIGGVGVAGGENLGELIALYEAIHGTADDIAGKGVANPMSLLLSRTMMFHRWGWHEAADLIIEGLRRTIADRTVTGDLASKMLRPKAKKVLSTKEFAAAVIAHMRAIKNPKLTATRVRKCRAVTGRCKCAGKAK